MPVTANLDAMLDAMSLEEQVGQLIAARVPGKELDAPTAALLRECHIANIVFFAHNIGTPEQTRALTAALQEIAGRPGLPAIIAADQEGGRVERLQPPATAFPSQMAFGAAGSAELVRRRGVAVARELRAVGINMNLAPALDVNNNPQNPVIGTRSYGERVADVTRLGLAALAGMREGGVLTSVKHFPGHGDTAVDSHFHLPTVPYERERLLAVELAPFRAAIAAGAPTVMSSHILFPAFDPELPCTLSRRILSGLLREEFGFRGVIVSDAMNMLAIVDGWGLVEGCVRFIEAGGDFVEPIGEERAVHAGIVAAVRGGRIPATQIRDSVRRMLALRAWVAEQGDADPAWYGAPEHRQLSLEVGRRAVTVIRDTAGLLPLRRDARVVVIETFYQWLFLNTANRPTNSPLAAALRPHFASVQGVLIDGEQPTEEEIAAAQAAVAAAEVVVLGTRGTNRFPQQAAFVERLRGWGKPIVAVALIDPYDSLAYPELPTVLATYGAGTALLTALAGVLAGTIQAVGTLPVTV